LYVGLFAPVKVPSKRMSFAHSLSLVCFLTQSNKFGFKMTPLITASLSLHIALIAAFPTQAVRDADFNSQQSSTTSDTISTRWSRQDIFTLVSVCVAVIGIFIGVLVASPAVRKWLYTPFHRKLTSF
jgi:hypothetical protein